MDTEHAPQGNRVCTTNHLHLYNMTTTTMTVNTQDNSCQQRHNVRSSFFYINLFYLYSLGYSRSPAQHLCRVRWWCWTWNRRHLDDGNRLRPLTIFTHYWWRWWLSTPMTTAAAATVGVDDNNHCQCLRCVEYNNGAGHGTGATLTTETGCAH